ncbi:hypothetical protein ANCCAN_16821 [Ancylostoma caninum]|uniref:Uncharacterized protein n=1 Tax=Ancylostoma caninum TaxID=29170 RepID=A0A368G2L2_ANCCA|nr:hypothetical protein ANCCAN_16821 [Ancylostoma caninum]
MLDQQRKFTAVPDNSSWKINDANKLDFKQIFDILLKEDDRGNFVDPRSELSEFLGLCNKLSCGDIYKSIDKFRRSDLFTNFQIQYFACMLYIDNCCDFRQLQGG